MKQETKFIIEEREITNPVEACFTKWVCGCQLTESESNFLRVLGLVP